MPTKICSNSRCAAFAHLVYTVAMRCVLCRRDLMAAQRNAGVAPMPLRSKNASELRGASNQASDAHFAG